jgi:hypothetical protein
MGAPATDRVRSGGRVTSGDGACEGDVGDDRQPACNRSGSRGNRHHLTRGGPAAVRRRPTAESDDGTGEDEHERGSEDERSSRPDPCQICACSPQHEEIIGRNRITL